MSLRILYKYVFDFYERIFLNHHILYILIFFFYEHIFLNHHIPHILFYVFYERIFHDHHILYILFSFCYEYKMSFFIITFFCLYTLSLYLRITHLHQYSTFTTLTLISSDHSHISFLTPFTTPTILYLIIPISITHRQYTMV